MKNLKLNQLEKSEMNEVRGGEAMNPCSKAWTKPYSPAPGELERLFERLTELPWEKRAVTWNWNCY